MPINLRVLESPINRYILVQTDQSVEMALEKFEEAKGMNWWHLVIELGGGRYAATQFQNLSPLARTEGVEFFHRSLGSLIDSLIPEVLVVEQSEIGTEAAKDLAFESPGRVLVVTQQGRFLGILYLGEAGGDYAEDNIPILTLFRPFKEGNGGSARPEIPRSQPRYANAVLLDAVEGNYLDTQLPIEAGSTCHLRLDIGELSPESAVVQPPPIPEHLLPQDIWLDVMVSSSDFAVGSGTEEAGRATTAHGRLFLPADGSPARTEEGELYLYFIMIAPQVYGIASARIGYYYRNHLVQSQGLTAMIGVGAGGYRIEPDYTLSHTLLDLADLPARRQVSILTNSNGSNHQIVVRPADSEGNVIGQACTYRLKEENIAPVVDELREILRERVAQATEIRRSKRDLEVDLRQLAPLGHELWHGTVAQCLHEVYLELVKDEKVVIQVSRPTTADYTFPWSLTYDIHLSENSRDWKLCPLVDEWDDRDEQSNLVAPGTRHCPKVPNGRHEPDTLCPFGFWGYQYDIEQLSSTDTPVKEIPVPETDVFDFITVLTQDRKILRELTRHVRKLKGAIQQEFPSVNFREGKDLASIKQILGQDSPFVYFLCHGERDRPDDPDTYLGVGNREKIRAQDFQDWVLEWLINEDRVVWNQTRPLIFINACHSLEINTRSQVTYLDAFITTGHAAGVIGTEVKVRSTMAMDFSLEFCKLFFKGKTVSQTLHQIRTSYLASGNLFGLIYTPYCRSDLVIVMQ